jgi:hypothetical protein
VQALDLGLRMGSGRLDLVVKRGIPQHLRRTPVYERQCVRDKKAQMRAGVHIIAHQVEPSSPARPALGSTHGANPPLIVTLWPGSPQQAEVLQAPAETRLSGLPGPHLEAHCCAAARDPRCYWVTGFFEGWRTLLISAANPDLWLVHVDMCRLHAALDFALVTGAAQ